MKVQNKWTVSGLHTVPKQPTRQSHRRRIIPRSVGLELWESKSDDDPDGHVRNEL